MNSLARSVVGAAVTAAAVYFLDPANGYERRLMLQDRYKRAARRIDRSTRGLRREASARYLALRPRADRGVSGWGVTARVLVGCAGGALIFLGIRERKALGEIGRAITQEVQRAMERNLRHDLADEVEETFHAAKEGAANVAGAARAAH